MESVCRAIADQLRDQFKNWENPVHSCIQRLTSSHDRGLILNFHVLEYDRHPSITLYLLWPHVTEPLPTLRTVQTGFPSTTVLPIPRAVIAALLTARRI